MLDRVMIATARPDFDADSMLGLLANIPAQEVTFIHCLEVTALAPDAEQAATRQAQSQLEDRMKQLHEHVPMQLKGIVRTGIPAQEIIRAARQDNIDTVIINAFVGDPREDFFLGATALETIRYTTTNMLVLHPPAQGSDMMGGLKRPLLDHVLFPTDFSDTAVAAFEDLIALAHKGMKHASLLHVQDAARVEPHLLDRLTEFDATDQRRLDEMAQRLRDTGITVDDRIELGVPELSIVRIAKDLDVSCIAIGARGRGAWLGLRWGRTSERVVRGAEVPVLVIKHEEIEPA